MFPEEIFYLATLLTRVGKTRLKVGRQIMRRSFDNELNEEGAAEFGRILQF